MWGGGSGAEAMAGLGSIRARCFLRAQRLAKARLHHAVTPSGGSPQHLFHRLIHIDCGQSTAP